MININEKEKSKQDPARVKRIIGRRLFDPNVISSLLLLLNSNGNIHLVIIWMYNRSLHATLSHFRIVPLLSHQLTALFVVGLLKILSPVYNEFMSFLNGKVNDDEQMYWKKDMFMYNFVVITVSADGLGNRTVDAHFANF